MQFDEVLHTRCSCRSYRRKPVEIEKIGLILEAAILAPSSGNVQNWEFVIVTDQGKRDQISKACVDQLWMRDAPVHLVMCNNKKRVVDLYPRRGELYSTQNCALAAGNLMLKSADIGLGSCWVGSFDELAIKRILRIPDGVEPELIITLGYPGEFDTAREREPITAVSHFETFGKKHKEDDATKTFPIVPKAKRAAENLGKEYSDTVDQIKKKGLFSRWFKRKK